MSDEDGPSTDHLAGGARGGDRDDLSALYSRVTPALYAWGCLRMRGALRRTMGPEDLVHEVWWRACDAFATFDAGRGSFRSWIFTIASNLLADRMRAVLRTGETPPPPPSDVPDDVSRVSQQAARDEVLRALIDEVRGLDDIDRDVFLHCGLEERSAPEAARLVGIAAEAAKKRWQRLRRHLRERVPDYVIP